MQPQPLGFLQPMLGFSFFTITNLELSHTVQFQIFDELCPGDCSQWLTNWLFQKALGQMVFNSIPLNGQKQIGLNMLKVCHGAEPWLYT